MALLGSVVDLDEFFEIDELFVAKVDRCDFTGVIRCVYQIFEHLRFILDDPSEMRGQLGLQLVE